MTAPGPHNAWLIAAGVGSASVALLHVAIVLIGPPAYRYFGAGELAPLAENGSLMPAIATAGIALVFATFAAYAFSGAGLLRRLPYGKPVLIAVGGIYTLRGLLLLRDLFFILSGKHTAPHMAVFSLVSLLIGIVHLVGTMRLTPKNASEAKS